MKPRIGVIGSAEGSANEILLANARDIGNEIAKYDCLLLSGATYGLPYEAVKGAKEAGGFTIGISPAINRNDHVERYKLPVENFDHIIFTGFDYKGRNVIFIRNCDAVIGISGGWGTLNEYSAAIGEGKVAGVLTGSGGVSDVMEVNERACGKKKGKIIYNSEPKVLVREVVESL